MGMVTERDPQYTFAPASIAGNFPGLDSAPGSDDVGDRVIAPIPNKAQALKEEPFIHQTYIKAEALIRDADTVVAIGYSFNRHDNASYERLLGALGQSPGRKMLVVSPDSGAIVKAIHPAHSNIDCADRATFRQW
jgi:thiamine pyrophosphate-dependent acetolactate synthase large subunit-like protein